MRTYKNKVTGAIISVDCECSGENWEPVKPKKPRENEQEKAPEDGKES